MVRDYSPVHDVLQKRSHNFMMVHVRKKIIMRNSQSITKASNLAKELLGYLVSVKRYLSLNVLCWWAEGEIHLFRCVVIWDRQWLRLERPAWELAASNQQSGLTQNWHKITLFLLFLGFSTIMTSLTSTSPRAPLPLFSLNSMSELGFLMSTIRIILSSHHSHCFLLQ